MKYCNHCGGDLDWKIPDGDNLPRYICRTCSHIHYSNPRIIVGCLPVWREDGTVLLCRRSIEPRYGYWTLPSGFMENGETVEQGGLRETREEANAEVEIRNLHAVYSIPHISQVYMLFLADLKNLNFSAGPESLEVRLFAEDEIPWEDLAFSSVRFSLERYFDDVKTGRAGLHVDAFIREESF